MCDLTTKGVISLFLRVKRAQHTNVACLAMPCAWAYLATTTDVICCNHLRWIHNSLPSFCLTSSFHPLVVFHNLHCPRHVAMYLSQFGAVVAWSILWFMTPSMIGTVSFHSAIWEFHIIYVRITRWVVIIVIHYGRIVPNGPTWITLSVCIKYPI